MCETLYVSDLDGTLLNRQERISETTAEIINSLAEQGMRFTFATARSWSSARKATAGLPRNLPAIVYNGAFIVDGTTGARLWETGFSQEERELVREMAGRLGLSPLVYAFVDGAERVSWLGDRVNPGMAYYLGNREGDPRLRETAEEEELYRGNAFYFTFISGREELAPLWEQMRDCLWANVTFQQELYRREYWLELMPKGATKAHAARELKRLLGCDRLVAFGDAVNDLPLFQAADRCYAVANAVPELKAVATGVIGSNQEDGVARWLAEHWELGEEASRPRGAFRLRPYESRDLEGLISLFYETVHTVNRRDYSEEQVNAWVSAPDAVDRKAWAGSLAAHFTLVAVDGCGSPVGFADLDGTYLDRLYVHRDWQGQGVATALADALEARAWAYGAEELEVHASLTARPFFEKRGYRIEREQQVLRQGIPLINFIMKKLRPQGKNWESGGNRR